MVPDPKRCCSASCSSSAARFSRPALSGWLLRYAALLWWSVAICAAADADWIGRSRDEVVAQLGKPVSVLERGGTQVLMYANRVRVEIRENVVVGFRSDDGAMLVKSDGSRYLATERGRVQRVNTESLPDPNETGVEDALPTAAPEKHQAAADSATDADASIEEDEADGESAAPGSPAQSRDEQLDDAVIPDETADALPAEELVGATQSVAGNEAATKALENLVATGVLPGEDDAEAEEEPSAIAQAIGVAISALLRFGFAVLMLRIAISWVELPCYMPDVLKVAALYTAIREGMHGLGGLGGHWEWILLFRLDDGVSFLALMFLLYRFKIALAGITALKIACATKLVTYFLMLIAGVAISFGLSSL